MALKYSVQSGTLKGRRVSAARPCRVVRGTTQPHYTAIEGTDGPSTSGSMSRRSLFLGGLALLPALLPAQPSRASVAQIEEGIDEYARLEAAGKLNTTKSLEAFRAKYNFKRGNDGRVFVKSSKGVYYAVRLDMEVPGAMLFRNTSSGEVYALQTDAFQQVDLSADQVVMVLLGNGEWEQEMSPIEFEDDAGNTKVLTMNETDFRNVVSLINLIDGQGQDEGGEENK